MMRRGEDGQVLTELALALPLLAAAVLLVLQLAVLQHVRLACRVAAWQAARAGIVHAARPAPMFRAAAAALAPTLGRSDGPVALAAAAARALALGRAGPGGPARLRVVASAPPPETFGALGAHLGGRQLDFDDTRPEAAAAHLLSVEVVYLYEPRLPLAGRLLHELARARRAAGGRVDPRVALDVELLRARGRYVVPVVGRWTLRMQTGRVHPAEWPWGAS